MSLTKLNAKHHTKKIAFCAALTIATMLSTGFTTARSMAPANLRHVAINVDGQTIKTDTTTFNPDEILSRAGVKLSTKDKYSLEKVDEKNTKITVYRAVPVTVTIDGQKQEVMTSEQTVRDALKDLGYNFNLDTISVEPGLDTKIHENLDITVKDNTKEQEAQSSLPMIETEYGPSTYSNVISMEASAYLPSDGGGSGITALGLYAQHGVVAVDPDVIPLGTHLYIPGYGVAIAADTGGAIYGSKIDLCMDTYGEAMNFGRRYVDVYILD